MFDIAIGTEAEAVSSLGVPPSTLSKLFSPSTEGVWEKLMAGELKVGSHKQDDTACLLLLAPVPSTQRTALTKSMQHVLGQLLSGVAQKVVGYDLSRSPSSICGLASSALRLIGLDCSLTRSPLALAVVATQRTIAADWRLVTEGAPRFELRLRHPHQLLPAHLSAAEHDVARMILDGLSHGEIARIRRRSARTVANQVHSIFEKLHVSNRFHLLSTILPPA